MMSNIGYLKQAVNRAFFDKDIDANPLSPAFIINRPEKKQFFLPTLQEEFAECVDFTLSVAFITQSGLDSIKAQLMDLHLRGIKGRILTSTYLGFNNPDVFLSLLKIPNVEVRISDKEGFHSKGYLFNHKDHQSFIIGSSNLTMSALKINYEWNVKLTSLDHGELISEIKEHLEEEWENAEPLTEKWISSFKINYKALVTPQTLNLTKSIAESSDYITPNTMQKAALNGLTDLRNRGEQKGLIISATGTGKTYLAAFDVGAFKPEKMLFVVHREQILNKAMETFKKILGGDDADYGILSGSSKEVDAKYLFATIQTISKEKFQQQIGAEAFDYILIDEVHKAGAESYTRTIDFFKPKFLLGMTATPERTDGFNIFELFDYNIAYEIRLQEALKEDLLCPFHYFGVTDYEKNGNIIDETADLKYLTDNERVDFLIEKIDYYGCYGNKVKGLVFCSRKDEAQKLARLFNEKGIPSSYLSGDHSIEAREKEVEKLENGLLNYIFTVDIFNEGIDIPKINQVIMLRNTQSNIIFIQQLGRGLRKDPSKEFVTIIDFIGNYKNNYMIPMAFSEDNSRNKNNLRRDTFDTNYIEGLSTINFEKIAKERIFKSIDEAKLSGLAEIKKSFYDLKNRLNRVPMLIDFKRLGSIDPLLIASKEQTYYNFLVKIKENETRISDEENLILKFITGELLNGIRSHELEVLNLFLNEDRKVITRQEVTELFESKGLLSDQDIVNSTFKVLDLSFYEKNLWRKYSEIQLFTINDDKLISTDLFSQIKNDEYFVQLFQDIIDTGLENAKDYDFSVKLDLYKKYRRKDVLRALNMNFEQNEQGIGGYTYSNHHFAIFVTLDKGKDFKGSLISYEDEFLDEKRFRWFTKAPRTIESKEVKVLMNNEDWIVHLFVKRRYNKTDNETDFYYLGEVLPKHETIKQVQKTTSDNKKKNVVEMEFDLVQSVEPNIYKFLTGSLTK